VSVASASERRRLAPEEFRDVIGHFASGVTVITALHDGAPYGTTASAVSSLSLEPPMLLVCLNKQSSTGQAIAAARRFAVNILGEDQPDAAMRFARKGAEKFKDVGVAPGEWGEPLLADALATLECVVVEEVTGGTHSVFLAEVHRASARTGAPLAYFRGQFGRLELQQDESAFRELRAMLLRRELPVDRPLDLPALAEQTGIARGPLYHACAKLTGEGLVVRDESGAFVVPPLTSETVADALRARETIELGVAADTVGRVSDEQVAEFRRLMEATRTREPDGSPVPIESWVTANTAFHEFMVGLAGSQFLLDAYRRGTIPAIISSVRFGEPLEDAADEHRALVEAYERSDLDAAVVAIRRHAAHALRISRENVLAPGREI
jgi:flavin reductase (DIM6/NTAB) family NADH-FMN oxidoreductase RutF/DNA-binding GntR family transcriptional regulator